MNTISPEPIYLLYADLVPVAHHGFNKLAGPQGKLRPSKLPHLVAQICHWALLVRDRCYEVTSIDYEGDLLEDNDRTYRRPHYVGQWITARKQLKVNYERVKVGATLLSDAQIDAKARMVFEVRCKNGYNVTHTNCQDFVKVLYGLICVEVGNDLVSWDERQSWRSVPFRLSSWRGLLKVSAVLVAGCGALVVLSREVEKHGLSEDAFDMLGGIVSLTMVSAVPLAMVSKNDRFRYRVRGAKKLLQKLEKRKQYLDPELLKDVRAHVDDYKGFDIESINVYNDAGFEISEIVAALEYLGLDNQDGRSFALSKEASHVLLAFLLCQNDEMGEFDDQDEDQESGDSYGGYNRSSIDSIAALGFSKSTVVSALQQWECDTGDGAEFEFSETDLSTMLDTMLEIEGQRS